MPDRDIIRDGENIGVPLWQCTVCGTTGETAAAETASAALLEHVRAAHPQNPVTGPVTDDWRTRVEAKHGLPLAEIPGHVYALHYEVPQVAKSVSLDYAGPSPSADADGYLSARPIRHYVGWTQQVRPSKRYTRHGPAAHRELVYLQPGTMRDEQALKLSGTCPKCGERLATDLAI